MVVLAQGRLPLTQSLGVPMPWPAKAEVQILTSQTCSKHSPASGQLLPLLMSGSQSLLLRQQ